MKRSVLLASIAIVVGAAGLNTAQALPQFRKAFDAKYVKTSKHSALKSAFKRASCNTCHIKGAKSKKEHNDYGKALNKLIDGSANARIKAAEGEKKAEVKTQVLRELEEAFKKVEQMKRKGAEKTYGERIKNGQLPTDVQVAKKKQVNTSN